MCEGCVCEDVCVVCVWCVCVDLYQFFNTCFSHHQLHIRSFPLLLPSSFQPFTPLFLLSFLPHLPLLSPLSSSSSSLPPHQDPDYVVEMNEEHPEFKKLAFTSPGPKNAFAPLKRVLGRKGTSFVKSEDDSVFIPPGEEYGQGTRGVCVACLSNLKI